MPDLVRVLMVEDVADDAALIERELRRAGIRGATRRVDSESAYRLGANSYIVKPVDFEAFARAVSEVGLYWLLLNEQPH